LVVQEDDRVVPRQPTHGAEASSSRAEEREPAGAPLAYFNKAQAEQALRQEFRDHRTSLNNSLNEALRIHARSAWWIFKVCAFTTEFEVCSCCFCARAFPDFAFSRISFTVDRSLRARLERGITASIS
jgi:hypothetical protein